MKRPHPRNTRLTSKRAQRKKYFIDGVVKRGSSETRIAVRRWTWWCVKYAFLAAVAVGAYFAITEGWRRLFWENPNYALDEVRFTTDGSLTRQQALDATKFKVGSNIFSYKLPGAREALRKLPQVDQAEIRRYLPNRIEISVTERKPVAWIAAKPSKGAAATALSYLLDARGLVFQPKHTTHEYDSLPVVSGVEVEDLEPGRPVRKAEVVAALELLRRVGETGELKVHAIDVAKGYCFTVTDQRRTQLTFGLDDIEEQLQRLGSVQTEAALIGQDLQSVNLMLARNIPVTFVIPPPPEPPDAEMPEATITAGGRDGSGTRGATSKGKAPPAGRKDESPKSKDSPKRENVGVFKRFRA